MKHEKTFIGIFLLLVASLALVFGQSYKSQPGPGPQEQKRVAGLTYWLQDENPIPIVIPVAGAAVAGSVVVATVGQSNTLWLVNGLNSGVSNAFVFFPDPTNCAGAVFNIMASGRTVVQLTNGTIAGGGMPVWTDITNLYNGVSNNVYSWTMQSNTAVRVRSTGTNWVVMPEKM